MEITRKPDRLEDATSFKLRAESSFPRIVFSSLTQARMKHGTFAFKSMLDHVGSSSKRKVQRNDLQEHNILEI